MPAAAMDTPPGPPPPGPPITALFGILEIGMALGMFLSGMIVLQTTSETTGKTNPICDSWQVIVVLCVDLFHSAVFIKAVHTYTIDFFGDFDAAGTLIWSMKMTSMMLGINISVVQLFFCMRVYLITRSVLLAAVATVLALARFVIHIRQMVTVFSASSWVIVRTPTFKWEVTSLLVVGASSDVLVAVSICWALLRMRSGFTASDKLVDKLVAFTIGSGLLTSIVAVIEVVTYLAVDGFIFFLFFSLLGKIFSTSLLASLNERNHSRRQFVEARTFTRSAKSAEQQVSIEMVSQRLTQKHTTHSISVHDDLPISHYQ
ncbi:hypothetical protein EXIGLDRAFT_784129 [Exidia glandulosa HHB12029]|uniref:DUF6534 domain-containing protein n=1 Tax=Exidia glandulosa HHB12029 TaxID=1314781 RepID=A0A166MNU9_EXIGL|nr:hypothetical protein EXIGLDRAFT_784129 [Exidia glandulosa HHB12029]